MLGDERCPCGLPLHYRDARTRGMGADQDRLKDAVAPDRLGEGLQLLAIEVSPRLQRTRLELAGGKVALGAGRGGRGRAGALPQQGREAAAEAALRFGAHALSLCSAGGSVGSFAG